jgi:DAK2 domain fusion protein YloV
MSARGNSGVILSQIVRGAADVLRAAEAVDGTAVARAFRGASDAAYGAVRKPVEGTMLTVIRALAESAERSTSLEPRELLAELVERGEEAVARTPEQLDVLREAGVVDAGGAGLLELVRGLAAAVAGETVAAPLAAEPLTVEAVHQELSRYRYCTTFVVEGDALDAQALEAEVERLGDSLLVVGDRTALKIHVHTDDPGAALSLGTRAGAIEGVEIADMHRQTEQREERLLAALPGGGSRSGVVAVVAGDGNRRLFEELGAAHVVEGGQTMNPSTADLLAAVEAAGAEEVVLLPNNSNVVLAAEQAARRGRPAGARRADGVDSLRARRARRLPRRPLRRGERGHHAGRAHGRRDRRGHRRSRDASSDGVAVRKGDYLGLVDGTTVAAARRSTRSRGSCSTACWRSRATCSRSCTARALRR